MAAARRTGAHEVPEYDVTLGDRDLADACADVHAGRWQGPHDVLAAAARDWDLRTHRMRVLADAAAATRCVESWQIAEPGSADAAVLRAEVEVTRVFRAVAASGDVQVQHLDGAMHAARFAADRYPEDPVPWVSMLTLARLYPGGHPEVIKMLDGLQDRDELNREGYHQFLRYQSGRYHGSFQASYDFALEATAFAPQGSPLPVLLQVARAEHYRHKIAGKDVGTLGQADYWSQTAVQRDIDITMQRWFSRRNRAFAADVSDLNYLAHALSYAFRHDEAAAVFEATGNIVTQIPWSYCGEPMELFTRWRRQALQGGGRR